MVKDTLIKIAAEKCNISKEEVNRLIGSHIDKLLPDCEDNKQIDKETNNIPKRVVYYKTEKEFLKLINNADESVELVEASDIDDDLAYYALLTTEFNCACKIYEYKKVIESYYMPENDFCVLIN